MSDNILLYKLEITSEELAKFFAVNGEGKFDVSCKLMELMTEQEEKEIMDCGVRIADVVKDVFIRNYKHKESLNESTT